MNLLAVLVVALAAASPTPAAPAGAAATATPVPGPTIKPVQWQGVTLGEDIDAVRTRLGKPDFSRKIIQGSALVGYQIHGGEGSLVIETSDRQVTQIRVEAAAPKQLGLPIGDPFGVDLGDSLNRLLTVRGEPTRADDEGGDESTTTYGGSNDNRWVYSMHSGMIYAITLVAPKLINPATLVPPRHGITLTGTPAPPPRHHIVIKGTPAPTPTGATPKGATPAGAPTEAPVATPSPTPIPGIAVTPAPSPEPRIAPPPSGHGSPTPKPTAAPTAAPTPTPTPNPNATPAADGSSVQTAIVVRAPDQTEGFTYIYKFVENIPCADGNSQYRIADQVIFSENRHNYAKVTGECPVGHDRRAFFFDITYIFTRAPR